MTSRRFENEQQFEEWNEQMARRYDPEAYHERSFFLIRWMERLRVSAILGLLRSSSESRVLEVGCGAGNVLERIVSDHRVGVDLSMFLLGKARHRLRAGADLSAANAEHIPLASGVFNKLVCTEVLEHVQNPTLVLEEMARVACAEADIVVSIPNEGMIDQVKGLIRRLGLSRLFGRADGEGYSVPEKMTDEWHLHHFDLVLLRRFLPARYHIEVVRAIPFKLLPLRYVVLLRLAAQAD